MSSNKQKRFETLAKQARKCKICPDLADKIAVLSDMNGNINPKVMFIAEAPGRQGADRTRKPFSGDKSGENFQKLLDSINLKREDSFITNAVLCSPRKPSGANRRPKKSEMNNCADYLEKTIDLIDPKIIVTLGTVALEALKKIETHDLKIKENVANVILWNKRRLIPLYHPSPQVIASHRNMQQQFSDYKFLEREIEKKDLVNMKKVKLYGLPHCTTCQKAIAYLEDLGVEVESFRDVKDNQLSKKEIEKLVKLVGGEEKLFSKRAMKYRSMGLNKMDLSDEDLLNYMVEEYTFIRRPVLVYGDSALAGFSKKKYDELLK